MKEIFIDVDGVVRDLDRSVLGDDCGAWATHVEGLPFIDYVTRNSEIHLVGTPETIYCAALQYWVKLAGPQSFTFLTAQPESWRKYTMKWLKDRFPGSPIWFVNKPKDKTDIVAKRDCILIEDYPFFETYDKIILVDKFYNKDVDCERITNIREFLSVLLFATIDGKFNTEV